MQYILLLIAVPIFVLTAVLNKSRRNQETRQTEAVLRPAERAMQESDTEPKEVLKKESRKPSPQPMHAVHFHNEGKHPDEIAENRTKVIEYERKNAELESARQEIREMDLKQLRNAVVMSEILDRPVSLRRRR